MSPTRPLRSSSQLQFRQRSFRSAATLSSALPFCLLQVDSVYGQYLESGNETGHFTICTAFWCVRPLLSAPCWIGLARFPARLRLDRFVQFTRQSRNARGPPFPKFDQPTGPP